MHTLPRPKASKRCTKCGGGGPFGKTSHRGTAYWRSECLACSRAGSRQRNRRWRDKKGAALPLYFSQQQRQRRLTISLALYRIQPTNVLANYIGRHTLKPGMKWCSYGQHALPATLTYFWISSWTNDGFMRNCKACRSAVKKAQYYRKKAHGLRARSLS